MKTSELKELSADDLKAKIRAAKAEIQDLRIKIASKAEVEKPGRLSAMRHEVARMLTVLNQKEAK